MRVRITGEPRYDVALVRQAAHFYVKELLSPRVHKTIDLTIKIVPKLTSDGEKVDGECDWPARVESPRRFCIKIDAGLTMFKSLTILAHEMTHLKQVVKGELKELLRPKRVTKWLGVHYAATDTDYWFEPWEVEARGYELALYNKFMEGV